MAESTLVPTDIVVVGGSVGALEILLRIVRAFPENFTASVFVVLHLSPEAPSQIADVVDRDRNQISHAVNNLTAPLAIGADRRFWNKSGLIARS